MENQVAEDKIYLGFMSKASHTSCRLCHSKAERFCSFFSDTVDFFKCSYCHAIFKEPQVFLIPEEEKKRYESHNNDIYDSRYQAFVSPVTHAILENHSTEHLGLDYGCGTGPVAAYLLGKKGYNITLYDPYFYPEEDYKKYDYDFIICCEVMEHFHKPDQEFFHLRSLLKPNGKLYCKTSMISDQIEVDEFKNWHYKNDPTHVFFYTPSALDFIKTKQGFQSVTFDDKLIIFST